ncbi:hypothetical protein N8577_04765, partial [Akkermansiaceae bacterium]|nr:hypothetical protein [Akkermansiaceae bacterium]
MPLQITPRNTLIAISWLITLAIGLLVGWKSASNANLTNGTGTSLPAKPPHDSRSLDSPSYLAEAQKIGRRKISD